jgi:hypothetical protein
MIVYQDSIGFTGAEHGTERLKGGANESQGQSDTYRQFSI